MTSPVITDPATGELLDGRYRLEERVGEGGMARVYRARDLHLDRTVAVKVMRGTVDELGSVERARSETTLLASLNHHALVTLHDAHLSDDDMTYLVMEFVDGVTLRDLIARGPLDPRMTAALAADIAEALHVAHAAGIVHRDIKPSNVLLTSSPLPGATWRPKLADFGIAYLHDSTRVTTPGLMVGTIAYLAPEQAEGKPPAPPADVYSLGIMLIEALSGAKPFPHAEGIAALVARMSTPPPIPQSLSDEWRQLLRGMTAGRPEDRPTALEVSTTAARLAGRTDAGGAAILDERTAATAPLAGRGPRAARDETEHTAVLPPLPPLPPLPADVAAATEGEEPEPAPNRGRGGMIGVLTAVAGITVVLVLAAVLFGLWSASSTATPAPTQTPPAATSGATPSATPEPVAEPEPTAPADTSTQSTGSGTGGTSGGNGNGNSNSGPGNNNGNGNGNSGNGNGRVNGNGNGNG